MATVQWTVAIRRFCRMLLNVIESYIVHAKRVLRDRGSVAWRIKKAYKCLREFSENPVECHILRWLKMTLSNWAKCPIEALGVSPTYCTVSFRQAEASS